MGKRSSFERIPRDFYPTPIQAVEPLIDHLPMSFYYVEPCAGDGRLVDHLTTLTEGHAECLYMSDIEPRDPRVAEGNALTIDFDDLIPVEYCITNPPWDRKFLHPFLDHWIGICPTWLLFDADWMHTKQAATYMSYCTRVVSVGRVKWIEDSPHTGKDNCCWYLFDADNEDTTTHFYGRLINNA